MGGEGDRRADLLQEVARLGSGVVREHVERLLSSPDPADQTLGADLAGEMAPVSEELLEWASTRGGLSLTPTPFSPADRQAVSDALREVLTSKAVADVIQAAIVAAGKLELHELAPAVARHASDADDEVRAAVGWTLSSLVPEERDGRDEKIRTLVTLARDPVDDVRMWALLALVNAGEDGPAATPDALAAYQAAATDPNEDVREEAVEALGLLGDVDMLAETLTLYSASREAVELACRLGDSRLHAPLLEHRSSLLDETDELFDPEYAALVDDAIAACAPPPG